MTLWSLVVGWVFQQSESEGGRMVYSTPGDIHRALRGTHTSARKEEEEEEGERREVHWDPHLVSVSETSEPSTFQPTLPDTSATHTQQPVTARVVEKQASQETQPQVTCKFSCDHYFRSAFSLSLTSDICPQSIKVQIISQQTI